MFKNERSIRFLVGEGMLTEQGILGKGNSLRE